MSLDFTLDQEHHDGFFVVDSHTLQQRVKRLAAAVIRDESAHLVYLSLEAKGEILPYFMHDAKTALGFLHQATLYTVVPRMFKSPDTRKALTVVIDRIKQDQAFRDVTFSKFDSNVRAYSLAHDIGLVDLLYAGSEPKAIADLEKIMAACEASKAKVFDRVALGIIYIVGREYDPSFFFKAEKGPEGVEKRNAQSKFVGAGFTMQEQVFRALLDWWQYFEDRYRELKTILPGVAQG